MNATAIALACESLGRAINRILEYDCHAPQALSEVAGKSLLIESTSPRFTVAVLFTDKQLVITPSDECSARSMLSGTSPALLRLLLSGDREAAEKCQVDVSDEDELIPTLLALSAKIDTDWEALLAEHTGDVTAHFVGKLLRKALQLQKDSAARSKSSWATYKTDKTDASNASNTDNGTDQQSHKGKPQSPLDLIGAQLKAILP